MTIYDILVPCAVVTMIHDSTVQELIVKWGRQTYLQTSETSGKSSNGWCTEGNIYWLSHPLQVSCKAIREEKFQELNTWGVSRSLQRTEIWGLVRDRKIQIDEEGKLCSKLLVWTPKSRQKLDCARWSNFVGFMVLPERLF